MARRSSDVVSLTMARVTGRDTGPELTIRRALWRRGLRYRLHAKALPGKPDIAFPASKVAVFVDGDFWHGNQWKLRGFPSLGAQFENVSNRDYWVAKVTRNVRRDAEVDRRLRELGWRVVRVWESDLRRDLEACVRRVVRQVQG